MSFLKGTTFTERLSFCIVLFLILCSISVGLYYKLKIASHGKKKDSDHPWNVTRIDWMAQETDCNSLTDPYTPLRLVIIHNSITHECYNYVECAVEMRTLQHTYLTEHNQDIPYNFMVGNDGRIYEGRGWNLQAAPSTQFYPCALVIGFIGDYREEKEDYTQVTEQQLSNTLKLLELGVQLKYLQQDYVVQGAKDLVDSESPGSNLHNAIKKWKHYDPEHRYKELLCDQIYSLENDTALDVAPHEWQISRDMWQAEPYNNNTFITDYEPIRLVVIHNTVTRECHSFVICKVEIKKLQMWYAITEENVPYNFIIANDGRVYESRGWGIDGGHSKQFNPCSISIGFLGEYSEGSKYNSKVTEAQINRTLKLLEEGVRLKHLDPAYVILGAKDIFATNSPGDNLYNEILKMEHYGHKLSYKNKTCDEIGFRKTDLIAINTSPPPTELSIVEVANGATSTILSSSSFTSPPSTSNLAEKTTPLSVLTTATNFIIFDSATDSINSSSELAVDSL